MDEKDDGSRYEVALFPKALRSFLRGSDDDPIFREDATKLVGPYTAEALMVSKNRATFVTNMISATVQRANLNPMVRARMDDCVPLFYLDEKSQ